MKKGLMLLFVFFIAISVSSAGVISGMAQIGFIHNTDSSHLYRLGFSRKAETSPLVDDDASLSQIAMVYSSDRDYFHSSYFYAYFQSYMIVPVKVELHAQNFRAQGDGSTSLEWIYTGDIAGKNNKVIPDEGYDIAFELVNETMTAEELSYPRFYNCSILVALDGSKIKGIDEAGYNAEFKLKLIAKD